MAAHEKMLRWALRAFKGTPRESWTYDDLLFVSGGLSIAACIAKRRILHCMKVLSCDCEHVLQPILEDSSWLDAVKMDLLWLEASLPCAPVFAGSGDPLEDWLTWSKHPGNDLVSVVSAWHPVGAHPWNVPVARGTMSVTTVSVCNELENVRVEQV